MTDHDFSKDAKSTILFAVWIGVPGALSWNRLMDWLRDVKRLGVA